MKRSVLGWLIAAGTAMALLVGTVIGVNVYRATDAPLTDAQRMTKCMEWSLDVTPVDDDWDKATTAYFLGELRTMCRERIDHDPELFSKR